METLPPELLIQIFQSADTFTTAQTLSITSHRLHNIWNVNSDAILPHVVECFPQARELAVAQEQNHTRQRRLGLPQRSMTIAQRVADNVTEASMTCAHFETCVVQASRQEHDDDDDDDGIISPRDNISSRERADFTRAYYRAMTLQVTLSGDWTFPRTYLDSLSLLEYLQMSSATQFLASMCKSSSVDYGTCPPTVRHGPISAETMAALTLLDCKLETLPAYPDDIGLRPVCGSFSYFLLSDGYMKNGEGAARGIRLAGLLASMGKAASYV